MTWRSVCLCLAVLTQVVAGCTQGSCQDPQSAPGQVCCPGMVCNQTTHTCQPAASAQAPTCTVSRPCKVIVDQDCGAAADTNTNAVLTLLLDPAVNVLGVTIVYGDGFQPGNYAHCYRLLEIFNRTGVPILWGAEQSTYRTKQETELWEAQYNTFPWIGMFNPTATAPSTLYARGDPVYSALREGCSPGLAARTCNCTASCTVAPPPRLPGSSAAQFIAQSIHAHSEDTDGPIVVVGLGPFTNLALARQLDPSIVTKAHLWLMAGSFNAGNLPQHQDLPRHETNLWFDPSASRNMLRADLFGRNWLSVTMVPADVCFAVPWTNQTLSRLKAAASRNRAAQYISECKDLKDLIPQCDELAALLLTHPHLGSTQKMYVDVDVSTGSGDGNTLSWVQTQPPVHGQPLADVFLGVDAPGFSEAWASMLLDNSPPASPTPICVG